MISSFGIPQVKTNMRAYFELYLINLSPSISVTVLCCVVFNLGSAGATVETVQTDDRQTNLGQSQPGGVLLGLG